MTEKISKILHLRPKIMLALMKIIKMNFLDAKKSHPNLDI